MPEPQSGESEQDFINRCVPIVLEDGTAEDREQAVAVCYSMWGQGKEGVEQENTMGKDYKSLPNFERKTIPTFIKAVDDKQGIVEHVVSVFGIRDLQGDRVMPGAFAKTIFERGQKVRVLDQHDASSVLNVLGKPIALREIGREELPVDVLTEYPEATGGLLATTQYAMQTEKGRDVFHLVDGGFLPETSIGYDPIMAEYVEETVDGEKVTTRLLKEIRLWEYSNVIWGANPATTTTGTKEVEPPRYVGEEDEKGASGSTSLPIADRGRAWDATAATARVRRATNSTDAPSAQYKNAFFWYDSSAADQFGSYKLPFADVVGGRLTAIPRGVFAVAQRLEGTDIPDSDKAGVRSRVGRYYARMRSQFDDEGIVPPWDKAEEPEVEEKAGRAFSARNVSRIRSAIGNVQQALSDLEEMLNAAMPQQEDEPEDEGAKDAPEPEEL